MMKKNWKNLLSRRFSFLMMFLPVLSFSDPASIDSAPSFQVARNRYNSKSAGGQKGYRAGETPHELKGIKVKEHIGRFIDLDLEFANEEGQNRSLKSYFQEQPVLMTVIYYNCPSLCNFHLNGLFAGLNKLKWKSYQFVVVSMDSTENSELAEEKKKNYLTEFQNLTSDPIHFLTGSEQAIQKLTDSLGFAFRWDEETQQFAHSPVAYSLSPRGMISRYLYGVEFLPQTLRLALLEAGKGKVGNVIDRILLFCYRFNPKENKYSLYAVNLMKVGGVLVIVALIALLAPAWIKERKNYI
ncbi:MAG: SCO family protein [Oligoflexia bacterium]|nr:SCO family protein [Oligoflexia bacterium]